MDQIEAIRSYPYASAIGVALGSFLAAWLFEVLILGLLRRLTKKTETELDDKVLDLLKRPIFFSLLMVGFNWAVRLAFLDPDDPTLHEGLRNIAKASFFTLAIVLWAFALVRMSGVILKAFAKRRRAEGLFQPRTIPLFDIVAKTAVLALGIYAVLIAWHINVTAWLASAGVLGVAVGLAAQDSLANYFAGVFIIADAPYKLHDVITLEDGTRGRVTDIGLRSTRIHTRDGVEINIPNSILGSMKIENRSAGPALEERVVVEVGVAYGSDVDHVMEILERATEEVPHIVKGRDVEIYFTSFGASSLDFQVKVWIHPLHYETVRHDLHVSIYKALNTADIEIPFPQTDLHVKELPPAA